MPAFDAINNAVSLAVRAVGSLGVPQFQRQLTIRTMTDDGTGSITPTDLLITPNPQINQLTPRVAGELSTLGNRNLTLTTNDFQVELLPYSFSKTDLVGEGKTYFVDETECRLIWLNDEDPAGWKMILQRAPQGRPL